VIGYIKHEVPSKASDKSRIRSGLN